MSAVCKCSIKTRLIGYVACFIVGMLLSFISTVVFLVKKDYVMFAILYSLGQFLNITGYIGIYLVPVFLQLLKHK